MMSTATFPVSSNGAVVSIIRLEQFTHESAFRCDVLLCEEEDGGYSAHCLNLAGVISQGDNESEAVANVCDAFRETILYFRQIGRPIPWGRVAVERTGKCLERFAIVRI